MKKPCNEKILLIFGAIMMMTFFEISYAGPRVYVNQNHSCLRENPITIDPSSDDKCAIFTDLLSRLQSNGYKIIPYDVAKQMSSETDNNKDVYSINYNCSLNQMALEVTFNISVTITELKSKEIVMSIGMTNSFWSRKLAKTIIKKMNTVFKK